MSLSHLLTLSCLEIPLTRVVWTFNYFENNFGFDNNFTKYSKETCGLDFVHYFTFKYFVKIPFRREISPKDSCGFQRYRHELVKVKVGMHMLSNLGGRIAIGLKTPKTHQCGQKQSSNVGKTF